MIANRRTECKYGCARMTFLPVCTGVSTGTIITVFTCGILQGIKVLQQDSSYWE